MDVKVPDPVVVMPTKPIQSAVTVPVLKLSVEVPAEAAAGVNSMGLAAVPEPSDPAVETVVVPDGN